MAARRQQTRAQARNEEGRKPTGVEGGKAGAGGIPGCQVQADLLAGVAHHQLAALHGGRGAAGCGQVVAGSAAGRDSCLKLRCKVLPHTASIQPVQEGTLSALPARRRPTWYREGSIRVSVPNIPSAFSVSRCGCRGEAGEGQAQAAMA